MFLNRKLSRLAHKTSHPFAEPPIDGRERRRRAEGGRLRLRPPEAEAGDRRGGGRDAHPLLHPPVRRAGGARAGDSRGRRQGTCRWVVGCVNLLMEASSRNLGFAFSHYPCKTRAWSNLVLEELRLRFFDHLGMFPIFGFIDSFVFKNLKI